MTVLSTLTILPENKEQMAVYQQGVKDAFINGEHDVLKLYKQIRLFVDSISETIKEKEIKEVLINEAEKHGKAFELHGAKFQVVEMPKYDYSPCKYHEYETVLIQIAKLTETKKAMEKEMQSRCFAKGLIVDENTGDILALPFKSSETQIKISLK